MNGKKSPLKISTLKGVLKCHSGNTMPREFPLALWRLTSNHKIISWTDMCWGATVAESGGAHMRAVDCPTQRDSTAVFATGEGSTGHVTPSWKDLRTNSWWNNTFIKTKNLSHVYPFIQESLFKHLWYAKHQAWAGEEKLDTHGRCPWASRYGWRTRTCQLQEQSCACNVLEACWWWAGDHGRRDSLTGRDQTSVAGKPPAIHRHQQPEPQSKNRELRAVLASPTSPHSSLVALLETPFTKQGRAGYWSSNSWEPRLPKNNL